MTVPAAERKRLPASQFGVPSKKKYLINTQARARSALSYVKANGTPAEQKEVQNRVKAKYPFIKVTKGSK